MRTDVLVVPVSVRDVAGRSTLVALQTAAGGWARTALESTTPRADATKLLEGLLQPVPSELLPHPSRAPKPVAFGDGADGTPHVGSDAALTLVYSVAVPMAMAAELGPYSDRWVPLLEPERALEDARKKGSVMIRSAPDAPQLVESILDFWRRQLEETASALTFLAEYWTMSQLRDVYSAVWGYQQDTAGFGRWADPDSSEGAFFGLAHKCDPAEFEKIQAKMAGMLERASDSIGGKHGKAKPGALALRKLFDDAVTRPGGSKAVGVSLGGLAGMARASAMPIAGGSLAVVAARVAFQPDRRGPQPKWYQCRSENNANQPLPNGKLYTTRPAWMNTP
ncbi:hypothetical protein [Cellulomonas sp. Leaf395]|uniref:hypothetical protein n=1 Tax=Cellulomonas sp. Leaf395 TaxID=1736362 RepID=UPI000A5546C8|nr:hypothetical protein [Cellulomonas sp. Leaf395]